MARYCLFFFSIFLLFLIFPASGISRTPDEVWLLGETRDDFPALRALRQELAGKDSLLNILLPEKAGLLSAWDDLIHQPTQSQYRLVIHVSKSEPYYQILLFNSADRRLVAAEHIEKSAGTSAVLIRIRDLLREIKQNNPIRHFFPFQVRLADPVGHIYLNGIHVGRREFNCATELEASFALQLQLYNQRLDIPIRVAGPIILNFPEKKYTGELAITSEPSGAKVFLNNKLLGQTPLPFPGNLHGIQRLEISMDGYAPLIKMVDFDSPDAAQTHFRLKKLYAIRVNSNPPNAQVIINKNYVGNTPYTYYTTSEKDIEVLVYLAGYSAWRERIQPRKKNSVQADLKLAGTYFNISTTPGGAEIYLNGKSYGSSPLTVRLDNQSRIQLQAVLNGYQTLEKKLDFLDDCVNAYHFTLSRAPALKLAVQPEDAHIYINGRRYQPENGPWYCNSTSSTEIKIFRDGYLPWISSLSVEKDTSLAIVLVKDKSKNQWTETPKEQKGEAGADKVYITSLPSGADVYIEGKKFGKTPLRVDIRDIPSGEELELFLVYGQIAHYQTRNFAPGEQVHVNLSEGAPLTIDCPKNRYHYFIFLGDKTYTIIPEKIYFKPGFYKLQLNNTHRTDYYDAQTIYKGYLQIDNSDQTFYLNITRSRVEFRMGNVSASGKNHSG